MTHGRKSSSVSSSLPRIALIRHGLSTKDLSEKTALAIGTVRGTLNGCVKCTVTRRRIEAILGPIWTGTDDLRVVAILSPILGKDPALVHIHSLRRMASEMRIRGRSRFRKKNELINAMAAALTEQKTVGGTKTK